MECNFIANKKKSLNSPKGENFRSGFAWIQTVPGLNYMNVMDTINLPDGTMSANIVERTSVLLLHIH